MVAIFPHLFTILATYDKHPGHFESIATKSIPTYFHPVDVLPFLRIFQVNLGFERTDWMPTFTSLQASESGGREYKRWTHTAWVQIPGWSLHSCAHFKFTNPLCAMVTSICKIGERKVPALKEFLPVTHFNSICQRTGTVPALMIQCALHATKQTA